MTHAPSMATAMSELTPTPTPTLVARKEADDMVQRCFWFVILDIRCVSRGGGVALWCQGFRGRRRRLGPGDSRLLILFLFDQQGPDRTLIHARKALQALIKVNHGDFFDAYRLYRTHLGAGPAAVALGLVYFYRHFDHFHSRKKTASMKDGPSHATGPIPADTFCTRSQSVNPGRVRATRDARVSGDAPFVARIAGRSHLIRLHFARKKAGGEQGCKFRRTGVVRRSG